MSRTIQTCLDCGKDTFWDLGSEPCRCYACQQRRDEATREARFAGARGSANSSAAKDALKKEIAKIVDDAFTAGFDADNAGALGHFDGFALAEAAIEKYWPNDKLTDRNAT